MADQQPQDGEEPPGVDPGGGDDREISPECEDWKYVTNNTRIVVLPDPRLSSILNQEDDQSSTGTSDHVQGEGLDDLTYDYEPGIALQHMEFACQRSPMVLSTHEDSNMSLIASTSSCQLNGTLRGRCSHCGVDYESGRHIFKHYLNVNVCF